MRQHAYKNCNGCRGLSGDNMLLPRSKLSDIQTVVREMERQWPQLRKHMEVLFKGQPPYKMEFFKYNGYSLLSGGAGRIVYCHPEIFNAHQRSQFTSKKFTDMLLAIEITISMDGKSRRFDNIFVERLWHMVKYEEDQSIGKERSKTYLFRGTYLY